MVEPEQILNLWDLATGQQEVLIQWKGLPSSEASWESVASIQQHF